MLDKLEKILQEMGVKYERPEEKDFIICLFQRDQDTLQVFLQIRDLGKESYLLQANVLLPGQVYESSRQEALYVINDINQNLSVGKVTLDMNNGELIFSWPTPFMKEPSDQTVSLFLSLAENMAWNLHGLLSEFQKEKKDSIENEKPPLDDRIRSIGKELMKLMEDANQKNEDRRMELCQYLIDVVDKKHYPEIWASAAGAMGLIFCSRYQRSNDDEDYQTATKFDLSAIDTVFKSQAKFLVVGPLINHGDLLAIRYERLDKDDAYIEGVKVYRSAIDLLSENDKVLDAAKVLESLGLLFESRYKKKNEDEALQNAADCYDRAIEIYTTKHESLEAARIQTELGNMLNLRYKRNNEENSFETANKYYRLAMNEYLDTENIIEIESALTKTNIGVLLTTHYRREGDEQAYTYGTAFLRSAIDTCTRKEDFLHATIAMANLVSLLFDHYIRTDEEEAFVTAKNIARKIIEMFKTNGKIPEAALVQSNLGGALYFRYERTNEEEAYAEGVNELNTAIAFRFEKETATSQNNLGLLLSMHYERKNNQQDYETAKDCFCKAVKYFKEQGSECEVANTQYNLGSLLVLHWERSRNEIDYKESEATFQAVLEPAVRQFAIPSIVMSASSQLALLELRVDQIEKSLQIYQIWLEASTNRYLKGMTEKDRLSRALEDISFSSEYARKLLECRSFKESLVVLDTGKARQISQIIGLEAALTKYSIEEKDTFKTAQNKVRAAEFMLERSNTITKGGMIPSFEDSHVTREEDLRSLAQARKELSELADQLGLETSVLRVEDLRQTSLPVGTAAVEILLGEESSIAFIWEGKDRIRTIELPDLSWNWLKYILSDLPSQVADWVKALNNQKGNLEGWTKAQEEIASCSERVNAGLDFGAGWYYLARLSELTEPRTDCHTVLKQAFANKIQATLKELEKRLWALIREALDDRVKKIILVPPGLMGLLPLSVSSFEVTIVPSLYTWLSSQKMVGSRQKNEESIIVSPVYSENELLFAPIEARWIKRRFEKAGYPTHDPLENQATILNIKKALKTVEYFHFSGHGFYNWNNPFESYLVCKGGELTKRLSVKELMKDGSLDSLGLCVMSACSSGVIDAFSSGEEFIGLPGAMLQAGVPAIVASLWSVDDLATMFLMDEFYRLRLKKKMSISGALKEASQWLRQATRKTLIERIDENGGNSQQMEELRKLIKRRAFVRSQNGEDTDRPFASPIYWAPFSAYGCALY